MVPEASNAVITLQAKQPIHLLSIRNSTIYHDLVAFGLKAPKSRTIMFPAMPADCTRHFIRGCWDGDGSIHFDYGAYSRPVADYVSGSRAFVEAIVAHLHDMGLPEATIHRQKRGSQCFYVKYGGRHCAKLYHLFYDGVDQSMYLTRKYVKFKLAAVGPAIKGPAKLVQESLRELLSEEMATLERQIETFEGMSKGDT